MKLSQSEFDAKYIQSKVYHLHRREAFGHTTATLDSHRATLLSLDVTQVKAGGRRALNLAMVAMMSAPHHPGLARVLGLATVDGVYSLAIERLPGDTLRELLASGGLADPAVQIRVLLRVAEALAALHRRKVTHGTLSSHTVSVGGDIGNPAMVKVQVFGYGLESALTALNSSGRGVWYPREEVWMAPELADGFHKATPASDVYGLGLLAWEVTSGEEPFANVEELEVVGMIGIGQRPECRRTTPEPLNKLMRVCWSSVPEKRPTMDEVVRRLKELDLGARRRRSSDMDLDQD